MLSFMTFANFKIMVAAYMTREVSSFTIGGVDILGEAINLAKLTAQRDFEFPQCRARAFISTNYFGASLATATVDPTATPAVLVNVRYVKECWKYATMPNQTGANDYVRVQRYEPISESDMHNIIPTRWDALREPNILPITYKQRVYVREGTIFLTGVTDLTPLWLDVIKWLPDYSLDADTDFFLTDYRDWMLLKTIELLNFHLKEDARVGISARVLAEKWNSVCADANRYNDATYSANTLD